MTEAIHTGEPLGVRFTLAARSVWLTTLLGVVMALLAWFRLPEVARRTLWAEDGGVFLQGAVDGGASTQPFVPYMGYLQFLPQIVADGVADLVAIPQWAIAMTLASCLLTALVAVVVFVCAREVVPFVPLRVLLASVTVLVPQLPIEVLGNLANIHWIVLWMMPWVLLYVPATRRGAWTIGILALVAALTEIQVIYFLPLLLFRPRNRWVWPGRIGFLVGLAAQLVATIAAPREHGQSGWTPGGLLVNYLYQVVYPLYQGGGAGSVTAHGQAFPAAVAGAIPLFALAATAVIFGTALQRWAAASCIAGSLVCWSAAAVVNGLPPVFAELRYGVAPAIFLLGSACVGLQIAVQHAAASRGGAQTRLLGAGAAIMCLLVAGILVAQYEPATTTRSSGPVWASGVARAVQLCRDGRVGVRIPIAPAPQWGLLVPCSRLP